MTYSFFVCLFLVNLPLCICIWNHMEALNLIFTLFSIQCSFSPEDMLNENRKPTHPPNQDTQYNSLYPSSYFSVFFWLWALAFLRVPAPLLYALLQSIICVSSNMYQKLGLYMKCKQKNGRVLSSDHCMFLIISYLL